MKLMSKTNNRKEKEYKKFINFGKIGLKEHSIICNEDNYIEKMKEDLNSKFINSNQYTVDTIYDSKQNKIIETNESLIFTKIIADNTHFFGTFSRISNNKDVLTNIIENTSRQKIDPNSIYFEHNTLFYIDFNTCAISFIKTNHIKNVYPLIELLLNRNNMLNLKIIPLIKSETEIQKTIIQQVEMTCAIVEIDQNKDFVGLSNLENMGCKIKDYTLKLSLSETKPHFSNNLLNFKNNNKTSLKKISISTQNEDIDLLTNTFTKSVGIMLSNNYEQDYSIIENTLREELLKAIQ